VHFFPNIPGWKEVALKKILEKKLKLRVFIDNDANLMGLGEVRLGAARGLKHVVGLTLGTGVGGGIIIDGKLYRGCSFSAGEAGHMALNETGPRCKCGGEACLEAYIGNRVILKEAKKIFRRNISLEELSRLAHEGNKKAKAIWSKAGRHLGIALTNIVNLLNPDAIVIGGGVAGAGRILFDEVRRTVAQRAMDVAAKSCKILKATLGNNAGLFGAALLVRENLT
jgi:glucokinase